FAIAALRQRVAGPNHHRQPHDRVVLGLPMHLGEHGIGLGVGEKAAALDRWQLRGVAEHQQRYAERHQVARELGIGLGAFVEYDEPRLGGGRLAPQLEAWHLLAAFARLVDQAVDGGGAGATLAAHHARRLAGEGRKQDLAVDALGQVLGERRLARSGVAEETKDRGAPARSLEPIRGRRQGGILVGREDRHRRAKWRSASIKNGTGTLVKTQAYNSATEAIMNEDVFNGSIRKFL